MWPLRWKVSHVTEFFGIRRLSSDSWGRFLPARQHFSFAGAICGSLGQPPLSGQALGWSFRNSSVLRPYWPLWIELGCRKICPRLQDLSGKPGLNFCERDVKKHSYLLINQKTIKVKKSMLRKHQGSELNQHIRVIQRLVPGRQHFIHSPIHLSSGISPLVGLLLQNDLGHLPATASFSGWRSFLIEHWPEFLTKLRLSLSAVPPFFAPFFPSFLSPQNIGHVHTLPLFIFLYPPKIDQTMSKRYFWRLFLPGIRKNLRHGTFFSFLVSPWRNNFRTISLDDYRPLSMPELAPQWRWMNHFRVWDRRR